MVIEVCQHCAKQTKSNIAYPMCCTNEDDAYNWCGQYINYGKKAKWKDCKKLYFNLYIKLKLYTYFATTICTCADIRI